MPPIDWAAIITAVINAIKDCQESNESKLLASIRKPNDIQRLRFEGRVRRELGVGLLEWRKNGREIMAEIDAEAKSTSDADLKALIKQAKAA